MILLPLYAIITGVIAISKSGDNISVLYG